MLSGDEALPPVSAITISAASIVDQKAMRRVAHRYFTSASRRRTIRGRPRVSSVYVTIYRRDPATFSAAFSGCRRCEPAKCGERASQSTTAADSGRRLGRGP
ncbi:hypothetical protein MRX96_047504 [Rhipicephalus microplus]